MSDPRNRYTHRVKTTGNEGDRALAANTIQLWDRLHAVEADLKVALEVCWKQEQEIAYLKNLNASLEEQIEGFKAAKTTTAKWWGWWNR